MLQPTITNLHCNAARIHQDFFPGIKGGHNYGIMIIFKSWCTLMIITHSNWLLHGPCWAVPMHHKDHTRTLIYIPSRFPEPYKAKSSFVPYNVNTLRILNTLYIHCIYIPQIWLRRISATIFARCFVCSFFVRNVHQKWHFICIQLGEFAALPHHSRLQVTWNTTQPASHILFVDW